MNIKIFSLVFSALLSALSLVGAMLFALSAPVKAQQPKKVSRSGDTI